MFRIVRRRNLRKRQNRRKASKSVFQKYTTKPVKPLKPSRNTTRRKLNSHLNSLNYDVVEQIFKYLPFTDTIQACKANDVVAEGVAAHLVKRNHMLFVELCKLWKVDQVFEMFGPTMRSAAIHENCFRSRHAVPPALQLLNLINQHCTIGDRGAKLHHIFLHINVPQTITIQHIPTNMEDYFVNLQTLALQATNKSTLSDHDLLLDVMTKTAKQLRSLTLRDLRINGYWFANLTNLHELVLVDTYIVGNKLYGFLEKGPSLQKFVYNHDVSDQRLIDTVCKYCPDIVAFEDLHQFTPLYADSYRYNYIDWLPKLKTVAITTHSLDGKDIDRALTVFAKQNTVESLTIRVTTNAIRVKYRPELYCLGYAGIFTQLHSLTFENYSSTRLPIPFGHEFFVPLPMVERINFKGEHLSAADSIRFTLTNGTANIFDISGVRVDEISKTLRAIADTKKMYEHYHMPLGHRITVLVSKEQWEVLSQPPIESRLITILVNDGHEC